MNGPFNPSTIEELRKLPKGVLLEMLKQAKRTIHIHETNMANNPCFGGRAGYLSIPHKSQEMAACQAEIACINQVLGEWDKLLTNGDRITVAEDYQVKGV